MDRKSEDVGLVLFVVLGVLLVGGLLVFTVVRDHIGIARILDTECTEDMDCWDCETMGNEICGVQND